MIWSPNPAREHGGPDALGAAEHDFSTNANACGPCPHARAALQQCDPTRYPDPGYTRLRSVLGDFHGVDASRIVVAGSASEFIFRVSAWAAVRGLGSVGVPEHAYGDYAAAARAHGLAVHSGSQTNAVGLRWLADPSSPHGDERDANGLQAEGKQTLLIVDRAYEPLRLTGWARNCGNRGQQAWEMWSPNKALGLTGVRAAYAVAPLASADIANELIDMAASWPVGAHGVALLNSWASVESQSWVDASRQLLRQWKSRQIAVLNSLGLRCLPSQTSFFCVDLSSLDSPKVFADLRNRGIKLRDATSFGLPGFARVSVRPPASQDALAGALKALLMETQ